MTEGFSFTTIRSDIVLPKSEISFEYRIVPNEDDLSSESGSCKGELFVRNSKVFNGYYNDDDANYFSSDGFFRTGDLVEISKGGQIVSAMRKKDVINKFGNKISCFEIEELLESIDYVDKAAVIGVKNDICGQIICAFIISQCKSVSKLYEDFYSLGVSEIKCPDKVWFLDNLPLNARLKVDRAKLAIMSLSTANI